MEKLLQQWIQECEKVKNDSTFDKSVIMYHEGMIDGFKRVLKIL